MNILVACKILPDDKDIQSTADGMLDLSNAHQIVSEYDLNALEAASTLKGDGFVKVITVGGEAIDDSKAKKNLLARGVDELYMTICNGALDSYATARELAKLANKIGEYGVILTGDGSADYYAKQTGVQLAAALDIPFVSNVVSADVNGDVITAKRLLENEIETVLITTPAVLSIAPVFAKPRICGMRDILAAGKKPSYVDVNAEMAQSTIDEVSLRTPDKVSREQRIYEDADSFIVAVKSLL